MLPFSKPSSPSLVLWSRPQDEHKGRLYRLCKEMEKDTAATSFRAYISSVDCISVSPPSGCVRGWGSEALAQFPKYLLRHPWYVV